MRWRSGSSALLGSADLLVGQKRNEKKTTAMETLNAVFAWLLRASWQASTLIGLVLLVHKGNGTFIGSMS